MSRVQKALHNDYQLLELMHDELGLQAHLFKADLKSRWQALEVKWSDFKEHLGRAGVAAGDAKLSIDVSAKLLADSLTASYTEIRKAFKS